MKTCILYSDPYFSALLLSVVRHILPSRSKAQSDWMDSVRELAYSGLSGLSLNFGQLMDRDVSHWHLPLFWNVTVPQSQVMCPQFWQMAFTLLLRTPDHHHSMMLSPPHFTVWNFFLYILNIWGCIQRVQNSCCIKPENIFLHALESFKWNLENR